MQPAAQHHIRRERFGFARQIRENDLSGIFSAMFVRRRGSNLLRGINLNAPLPDGTRPDPSAGAITQVESIAASSFAFGFLRQRSMWRRRGHRSASIARASSSCQRSRRSAAGREARLDEVS